MDGGERGNADARTTYYVITHEQPAGGAAGARNYGTVLNGQGQPARGQFPGQTSGVVNQHAGKSGKGSATAAAQGAPRAEQAGDAEQGSSRQPEGPPPTYADVIKGDNKVQGP